MVADQGGVATPQSLRSHEDCSEAVTLADRTSGQVPLGTLQGLVVQFCPKHSIGFHVAHNGVDGSFVALGVQTKRLDQFTTGAGSVVDDGRTDLGADDGSEHVIGG